MKTSREIPNVVGVEAPPRFRAQRIIDALRPYESGYPEVSEEIYALVPVAEAERENKP